MATTARTAARNKPATGKPEEAKQDTTAEAAPATSAEASPEPVADDSPKPAAEPSPESTNSSESDADPFDALFKKAKVEEKSTRSDERAALVVPQKWIDRVEEVYSNRSRVTFPVTDKAQYGKLAELLRAAADRSSKNITAMCRAKYEGEGDSAPLVGLTLTVGERRGKKTNKSAEKKAVTPDASAEKAETPEVSKSGDEN